ncbi:hypothetical protein [Gallibacterium anatis]|uniref:hypothetical protein n=1 Tax=Gallibacterium anatis TaxID=750 RepID=UPI000531760B|nr:hypothetical protein [Gallibacterium anatis]KGQ44467.1 hypothetical protein JP29_08930 [Gallibacterium anatis]
MIITLENGTPLKGDLTPTIIKRTDLVAIPSTVEVMFRADDQILPYITEGKIISVGETTAKYKIISCKTINENLSVRGDPSFIFVHVIGLLASCYEIAFTKERAVTEESTSLASAYRACGAKIKVGKDIKINKFTCLIGQVPSFSIQKALQLAAATIVWNGKDTVNFYRLRDLFKQKPKKVFENDYTQDYQSSFLERHQAPRHYSNLADGTISIANNKKGGRISSFEVNIDKQELNNLGTYLLQKKVLTLGLSADLNAGDLIRIKTKDYVIITATHIFSNPDVGAGGQSSRLWLGELSV